MYCEQAFELITTQNFSIAAGGQATFSLPLQNIDPNKHYGALKIQLRGTLDAGGVPIDLEPEHLDQLVERVNMTWDQNNSSINLSGASLSKFLNLTGYRRRNRESQLNTVGNDTDLRHAIPIPLQNEFAKATLGRACRVIGERIQGRTLQVTLSTLAHTATLVGTFAGEIRIFADPLPVLGDDASVVVHTQLVETDDIQGNVRQIPGADIVIVNRVPLGTYAPAVRASGITTFTIDGIVDTQLEPQEYVSLADECFGQPFRYDEARLYQMAGALGVHPEIVAGASDPVGIFKIFDRRNFKGTSANPTFRFPGRNTTIPLGLIVQSSPKLAA